MPDQIPTPEQLKALADRFGWIGIAATGSMVHSFADAALRKALECQAQDQDRAMRRPQPMTVAQWVASRRRSHSEQDCSDTAHLSLKPVAPQSIRY
jgi:hypothetical protein